MVIDTSALVAILVQEPEAASFAGAMARASRRRLSASSLLETVIVINSRHGEAGVRELDRLLWKAGVEIEPVTREQIDQARYGFITYGKGRHPAGLNFGDCFSYALARTTGEPLLFKGGDFSLTDVEVVELSAGASSTDGGSPA